MDVSVIIVNYNTFTLTSQCIESIILQTESVSFEIILVDNASTEVDPDRFTDLFEGRITLIKSNENVGFAKGNNVGIKYAKGKYILLLNSDTVLRNNAILLCKQSLDALPKVAAIGARLEYPDGAVQHNCQRFPSIKYKLIELLRIQKFIASKDGGKLLLGSFFNHREFIYPDWIWGTFFMFPKSILKEMKDQKLPDDFFMYGEDLEWCMEFNKLGYHIAFNPAAVVVHYMGKSGGAKSALMKSNMNLFMMKYYNSFERKAIAWLDRLLMW
jgi:GT2 family glycosyltransferase